MKRLFTLLAMCGLLAFAAQAGALGINPGMISNPNYVVAYGDQNSQSDINTAISSILGASTLQYDMEVGGSNATGPLAGSYLTTFSNEPDDPANALIENIGNPIIGGHIFLLVKDGDVNAHQGLPSWYLFDLTALSWDGMTNLELTDFWPSGGAISHITLYGSTPVPEPGTMLLLGSGVLGLAACRRKFRS